MCAAMAAGLSFAAHSAFVQMMDDEGRSQVGAQAKRPVKLPVSRHPEVVTAEQALVARIRSHKTGQFTSRMLRVAAVCVVALIPLVWVSGKLVESQVNGLADQNAADLSAVPTEKSPQVQRRVLTDTEIRERERSRAAYAAMVESNNFDRVTSQGAGSAAIADCALDALRNSPTAQGMRIEEVALACQIWLNQ